jgi:hypothetical protein
LLSVNTNPTTTNVGISALVVSSSITLGAVSKCYSNTRTRLTLVALAEASLTWIATFGAIGLIVLDTVANAITGTKLA